MRKEGSVGHVLRRRPVFTSLALLSLLAWGGAASRAAAQETQSEPPPRSRAIPVEELHRARGRILAHGKNSTPAGELRVKTYKLEEVALPDPVEFHDRGASVRVEKATRLGVSLDGIINGPYLIWIGDEAFTAVHSQPGELTALLLGPAVTLEEGSVVSVARGTNACDSRGVSVLPERLSVPPHLRRAPQGAAAAGNYVKIIRSVPAASAEHSAPDIELVLATDTRWPTRDQVAVLQIGEHEFVGDPDDRGESLVFRLTAEEFARARDGGRVKVKYGACSLGGVSFGRLDKKMLDRGRAAS